MPPAGGQLLNGECLFRAVWANTNGKDAFIRANRNLYELAPSGEHPMIAGTERPSHVRVIRVARRREKRMRFTRGGRGFATCQPPGDESS
jgi:hypothetical protein